MDTEKIIDRILIDFNDCLEKEGCCIASCTFNFNEGDDEWQELMSLCGCSNDELKKAFNTSITRKLLTYRGMGGGKYQYLQLTEEGQARAISAKLGKDRSYELTEKSVTFNFSGNITGGNNMFGNENTQIVQNFIQELAKHIDNSNAPDDEKKEAKEQIFKAFSHPLVNTALGIGSNVLLKLLG